MSYKKSALQVDKTGYENDVERTAAAAYAVADEKAPVMSESEISVAENTTVKSESKKSETVLPKSSEKEKSEKKKVFVYLGPSVKGVVSNGSIFGGEKAEILKNIEVLAKAARIENKLPLIERLVVEDVNVSTAREQLRSGGNGLSRAYQKIVEEAK